MKKKPAVFIACPRCGTQFDTPYLEHGYFNHENYTSDHNLEVEYNYRNLKEYMKIIEASTHPDKENMLLCIHFWLKLTGRKLEYAVQRRTHIKIEALNAELGSCMK
jgi:uncharacterized C2H2 Zn-finger protein